MGLAQALYHPTRTNFSVSSKQTGHMDCQRRINSDSFATSVAPAAHSVARSLRFTVGICNISVVVSYHPPMVPLRAFGYASLCTKVLKQQIFINLPPLTIASSLGLREKPIFHLRLGEIFDEHPPSPGVCHTGGPILATSSRIPFEQLRSSIRIA